MTKPRDMKALDAIAEAVLKYRPKAKSKPAVQRKRRRTILRKQQANIQPACAACEVREATGSDYDRLHTCQGKRLLKSK